MPIDRRFVLKGLAMAPFLRLAGYESAGVQGNTGTSPASVFILLHGMFFMEFYQGRLYVATPNHSEHHFCVRRTGGQLQKMGTDINLYDSLGHGTKSFFSTDIPQFPKSLIGNFGPRTAKKYRCKMILPLPKNIFGLRTDTKDNFKPVQDNKIGQAIRDSTGPRLATITCLEFDPGKVNAYVESYYAEHKKRPMAAGVNAALHSAMDICGSNFNLQLQPLPSNTPPTPPDKPGSFPNGVSQDDENELEELLTGGKLACDELPGGPTGSTEAVDVASCPQFGINP